DMLALPIRLRNLESPGEERDMLWQFLLGRFQAGPRRPWASVLIEAMRPDLAVAIASMPAMPPAISRDDIAQQIMAELLTAAGDAPAEPARWTPHRLMSRATSAVYRWLASEVRSLGGIAPELPASVPASEARAELAELLWEVEVSRVPSRALVLLYRQEIVGETLVELARDAGISVDALKKRRERAIKTLRRRLSEVA
ncbi:MAG: RNA polymerase sigma factor, partial [bacterium]